MTTHLRHLEKKEKKWIKLKTFKNISKIAKERVFHPNVTFT
jgi:hypothetical protein